MRITSAATSASGAHCASHGTSGVSNIEGSAGGGLSPWALIAGYGTQEQAGAVPGQSIDVSVVSAKLRVAGDAVQDQDSWLPQIALGVQW